jgi:hypothetical protein
VLGEDLQSEGFEVVLHRPSSFFHLVRSLYRTFRNSPPDVVHCHNATAAIIAASRPCRWCEVDHCNEARSG